MDNKIRYNPIIKRHYILSHKMKRDKREVILLSNKQDLGALNKDGTAFISPSPPFGWRTISHHKTSSRISNDFSFAWYVTVPTNWIYIGSSNFLNNF